MLLRPKPRTFTSLVLRTTAPRLLVLAVLAAVVAVLHLVAPGPSAVSSLGASVQPVVEKPSWTLADVAANPGCVAQAAWPAGTPAASLVVANLRTRQHSRMAFDIAWRLNHNHTEVDDVWVLGVCHDPR